MLTIACCITHLQISSVRLLIACLLRVKSRTTNYFAWKTIMTHFFVNYTNNEHIKIQFESAQTHIYNIKVLLVSCRWKSQVLSDEIIFFDFKIAYKVMKESRNLQGIIIHNKDSQCRCFVYFFKTSKTNSCPLFR